MAIPATALAAKPTKSPKPTKSNTPTVTYVLKGTLSNFTAASSTADGSIAIHVTHSNLHGRALKGMDLTFAVSAKTATTLNGTGTISNGARGIVKFRAAKNMTVKGLVTELTASTPMTAFQVIAH
ncbi:MAG TPA: hypothetical protein VKB43_12560 [Gaiellaceae bacterium]|nr:hypothetical protein [Gaiellaceae bacterium]